MQHELHEIRKNQTNKHKRPFRKRNMAAHARTTTDHFSETFRRACYEHFKPETGTRIARSSLGHGFPSMAYIFITSKVVLWHFSAHSHWKINFGLGKCELMYGTYMYVCILTGFSLSSKVVKLMSNTYTLNVTKWRNFSGFYYRL